MTIVQCGQPQGYAQGGGDCNDTDPLIFPGALEHCDGVDEDCDQVIDNDAVGGNSYYIDNDDDGFGDADEELVDGPGSKGGFPRRAQFAQSEPSL